MNPPTFSRWSFSYLNYNELGFGESVFTNGTFSLSRGEIIDDSNIYQQFISDLDENTLQIVIFTEDNANQSNLSQLSTTSQRLATLTFSITDCQQTRGLSFDEIQMQETGSVHYTGIMPIPFEAYDPIIAEDENNGTICGCEDPEITSFTPDRIPAGMGEILTINGQNFLTQDGESKIFFKNGDDGGLSESEVGQADIISWSNTQIEVEVPGTDKDSGWTTPPCSGKFKVQTRCGNDKSLTELEIPYSILSVRGLKSEKIAMKDELCIGFSSDIPIWARNTFKAAMDTWCAKINMNIRVDYLGDVNISSSALDGISVVTNEELSAGGGVAGLVICNNNCMPVATNLYIETCPGESNVFKEVDFQISAQALSGNVESLYNVLLHEIGHALMLNHSTKKGIVLNEEARYIMYYDQTNLNFNNGNRSIKRDDEEGALTLFSNSIQAIQNCGGTPITTGNCGEPCQTVSVNSTNFIPGIELFPNPNEGSFTLDFRSGTIGNFILTIYSLEGKIVYQGEKEANSTEFNYLESLSTGIYIVEVISVDGDYWAAKMIVE